MVGAEEKEAVKEVEQEEETGAVADAHLASLENYRTKTRDSPGLMMPEQPKLTTTTATPMDGTTTLVTAVPIAATRICTMM